MGVVRAGGRAHQNERRAAQSDHNPHHETDQGVIASPPSPSGKGFKKKETSLYADTHQKHDGCVHVEVFEVEAEETDGASERPVMSEVVIDPQRQRQDVGQVCERQVYHEDHRFGLFTDVSTEDPQGGGVEQESRQKQQQVEVCVHLLNVLLPLAHVVVMATDGGVPRCIHGHFFFFF